MNYLRFLMKRYLFALFSLAFVLVYWGSAHDLPPESIVFPKFITLIMIPVFIWVFLVSFREYKALEKDTSVDEKEKWDFSLNLNKRKLVIIGSTVLYIALIPVAGYCVTTILYVGGLSFYLGNRKPLPLILYTLCFFGILYAIFHVWLHIRLPAGFLF